ncbi:hypothetical protein RS84_00236 [Microbacterium hydrocarbonoxydans]|uniref:Uncharacterized protein n=1 Tax=Microbacterium hydrocarbonoxydans TaxID=273678 RepID=A0A0M2HYK1_9MICO|nr:hypothetical protein [Microbacterium hydrocarbonoxydans]KJL49523.1 hypothetical protein RS84_00236 [Microbacterium hydrocarbonoxydans]
MGREHRQRAAAEHKLRLALAKKHRAVVAEIARLLEKFPCPVCGRAMKVNERFRIPNHAQRGGVRCSGSLLAIGWFADGLAAVPYDRYDEPESVEARALLKRTLSPVAASERRSTSVIGDRAAPGKTVSGGLPGSKR